MGQPFSPAKQMFQQWRNFRPKTHGHLSAADQDHANSRPSTVLTLSLGGLAAANIFVSSLTYGYVLIALGAGPETDALFASVAVPRLILAVVGGSLTHVLLPVLTVQTREDAKKSGWNFFLLIGSVFIGLEVVLHTLAPFWIHAVVPGFSPDSRLLTVELARVQLAAMVLTVLCGVLSTVHQANKRFVKVELISLFAAGLSFLFLFWVLEQHGVKAAAWAVVMRTSLQLVLLLPGVGRFCCPDWRSPAVAEVWRRFKPLLCGTAYYKLGPMVDRFLSSMAPAGGLSLFYVGQQTLAVANDIIHKALTVPALPLLSRHAHNQDWPRFDSVLRARLWLVGTLTGGGYLIFFAIGDWLLASVARFGRISEADVHSLWWIIVALAGFLIAGALGQIASAAFYAKGNTKTPTKVGVFGFTVGLALKVVGFFQFGLVGIAAGTTLYYVLNFLVLMILQKRDLGRASAS